MEEFIQRLGKYKTPLSNDAEQTSSAEYYYDPFAHITVHEQLVNDYETISTFQEWIKNNKELIDGKVVVDVGCGIGLLSMMVAKAGASFVFSIDWSSIVDYTSRIVMANHLQHKIRVIKGKVNEITLPPKYQKVDVIISMWMGYSLFQGDKLKAVLQARDKWLKPNGYIIPDRAQLYISGIADLDFKENSIDWWKNVYGYDMSCAIDDYLKYAHYKVVSSEDVVTNKFKVKDIDLRKHSYKDIMKEAHFRFTARRNDFIQGLCTSFNIRFSKDLNQIELNTDPCLVPKFWGQTVFYIKDCIMIKRKESIQGSIAFFNVNHDPRFLGVILGISFKGERGKRSEITEFILRN